MAEHATETEFQFVNATLEDPTVPQHVAIRALIRKQAMKKASAARKRDGNYGKHNLRQYPLFLVDQQPTPAGQQGIIPGPGHKRPDLGADEDQLTTGTRRTKTSQEEKREKRAQKISNVGQIWMQNYTVRQGLVSPVSPSDYELMSARCGFDLLELSTLATMHVGRATRHAISADPYHLVLQMRSQQQWSYLSFLPSRYGHISVLSEAADCCVARAQQIVTPQVNGEVKVIAKYVKALDSLQKALDSPTQRYTPEVLCATQILAMYELLDPAGEVAWVRHAAGAGRLIQMRGPNNYKTDFEKALLMAHIGPLMTEALIKNEHTFLDQPIWQAVLRTLITEPSPDSIADRSTVAINLHILKSNIPGLFHDVTTIICGPTASPPIYPSTSLISKTLTSLSNLQSSLLSWRREYESILARIPKIPMETMEYDRQCKIFATYLSCQMITNRLLSALVPYRRRRELEVENHFLVKEMLNMERRAKERKSSALLFMAQTAGVAGSVQVSKDIWLSGAGRDVRDGSGSGSGSGSQSPSGTSSIGSGSESASGDSVGTLNGSGYGEEHLLPAQNLRAWCGIMGRKCL